MEPQLKDSYFLVLYRPGAAWVTGQEIRKQPLGGHLAYMKTLRSSGTLSLGGPFKDDSGGMVILEVETRQVAEDIVWKDPAVQAQVLRFEVHPWHPAAPGRIEGRPW